MRVLLDTNVFISGVFFSGPPYQILEAWHNGIIQLIISREIIEEYRRVGEVLSRQFQLIDIDSLIDLLILEADIIKVVSLPEPVCIDPEDDKFLACALCSDTKVIISGDKHLLQASGYRGIHVVTPRKFIDDYLEK